MLEFLMIYVLPTVKLLAYGFLGTFILYTLIRVGAAAFFKSKADFEKKN